MTKEDWTQLAPHERGESLKSVLQEIVMIDKMETLVCKHHKPKPCCAKFKLEQQALKMMAWEKEDSEQD